MVTGIAQDCLREENVTGEIIDQIVRQIVARGLAATACLIVVECGAFACN